MDPVFGQLLAEYPRFLTALEPAEHSRTMTVTDLAEPAVIERAVAAAAEIFGIDDPRHAGQLWWFSAVNSLVSPAVTMMVEYDRVPDLDLATGRVFLRDPVDRCDDPGAGYWIGFTPEVFSTGSEETHRRAGEGFSRSVGPVVSVLSRVAGIKPAPLWAVAADGLAQAAVEAGNEAFDPYLGVRVASRLVSGLAAATPAGVVVPAPRFFDIVDGTVTPTDMDAVSAEEEPDEVHTVVKRASCCMVYRSPSSGKCLSCPRQDPAERERKLIAALDQ
ncbi:(2Fe-2S)-binding protein [Corynebacterium sp. CCM 9185]|uniref:(2Fe-2S)-binding protein n=1 Tax=Corynebacterium marambiense TaxID=2765364 RepID=A0ABS0VTR4_9CORY|nr:(2Fe-2S)-binding protein [Corynebacterium marambiense]MBI9000152.1 (2Fe-2S)-binding protein [Corynebacterium marambiense]MCK7663506.1 (2Fe-2S)-binding protein [Corynebacterium marambiense]MCX7542060.1 (2Fe-2S)-binding protein [Corynebacterium marambiense]